MSTSSVQLHSSPTLKPNAKVSFHLCQACLGQHQLPTNILSSRDSSSVQPNACMCFHSRRPCPCQHQHSAWHETREPFIPRLCSQPQDRYVASVGVWVSSSVQQERYNFLMVLECSKMQGRGSAPVGLAHVSASFQQYASNDLSAVLRGPVQG